MKRQGGDNICLELNYVVVNPSKRLLEDLRDCVKKRRFVAKLKNIRDMKNQVKNAREN